MDFRSQSRFPGPREAPLRRLLAVRTALLIALGLALAGGSPAETADEFDDEFGPVQTDPLEPMNRAFFTFNHRLDQYFWRPVTRGYQRVMPEPGRVALRRFFANLNSPSIFANCVLQLRPVDAGTTLGRFVLNTTVGGAGFFDAGDEGAGWEAVDADFGQTLWTVGVGSGPYLVIPIFGPSTLRDGFGDLVDRLFQPLTYLLGPIEQMFLGGGAGIVAREEYSEELEELERSSVDFYSALRSVYLQSRAAQLDPE